MPKRGKSGKLSVTLPDDLVAEVRAAVPKGEVSAFFTEAVRHHLASRRQREALERSFGAWKDKEHPDLSSPQDSTSYVRALRGAGRERFATRDVE